MQGFAEFMGIRTDNTFHFVAQRMGRDRAAGIARMDARLFDMFHNGGNGHLIAVNNGIDIYFNGFFKEFIHQNRSIDAQIQTG